MSLQTGSEARTARDGERRAYMGDPRRGHAAAKDGKRSLECRASPLCAR